MRSDQRKRLGARLTQYGQLTEAGVPEPLALAIMNADAKAADRKAAAPADVSTLLTGHPTLKARVEMLPPPERAALSDAAAEVLTASTAMSGMTLLALASLAVMGGVLVILVVFVFPVFKDMFNSFGAELPAPTQIALFMGDWVLGPLGALVALVIAADLIGSRLRGRLGAVAWRIDAVKERVPLIRNQRRAMATRLLARWLAAAQDHLTRRDAIECMAELVGPGWLRRNLARLKSDMDAGKPLPVALGGSEWLPGLGLLLADATAGRSALAAYANSLDTSADQTSSRMMVVSQVALGVVLGFFVIAMYLPIFKLGAAL